MKYSMALVSVALLALLAGPIGAGELKPIPMQDSPPFRTGYSIRSSTFEKPADGAGTVSPKAVVAKHRNMQIALDSKTPEGPPAVLRIDATGKGTFVEAPTVDIALKETGEGSMQGQTEVVPLTLSAAGKDVCVRFRVLYFKAGQRRQFYVQAQWRAQGECQVGEKTVAVRVYFRDLQMSASGMEIDPAGDDFGEDTILALPGQPVWIGEAFYRIEREEWMLKATAVDLPAATIRVPSDKWELRASFNGQGLVHLHGRREPVVIPAGRYQVASGDLAGPGKSRIHYYRNYRNSTAPALQAPAGKTTPWTFGGPLTGKIDVKQSNGQLAFEFKLVDAGGTAVQWVYGKDGKPVAPPMLQVADGQRLVHRGKLEYG